MATTIANLALVTKAGYDPGNPLFVHVVSFDLKADWDPALPLHVAVDFKAAIGVGRTILGVVPIDCKGLEPYYDAATDHLIFRWGNYDASDGPLIDVPAGSMAAYTGLKLAILSQ